MYVRPVGADVAGTRKRVLKALRTFGAGPHGPASPAGMSAARPVVFALPSGTSAVGSPAASASGSGDMVRASMGQGSDVDLLLYDGNGAGISPRISTFSVMA